MIIMIHIAHDNEKKNATNKNDDNGNDSDYNNHMHISIECV
jgi:hypothetical protein